MKAVAFDLGDTLVEYEGVPLNWEAYYAQALAGLASSLGHAANAGQIDRACSILRRYNTRINPREEEFSFSIVLADLLRCWGIAEPVDESASAKAFFGIFRQRLRCFPDARPALEKLRSNQIAVGIFTDVPYGMPRDFVVEDLKDAGLENVVDVVLTSRDVGSRKPSVKTLTALANALKCHPGEMVHVGNEKKDIEVAQAFGCRSILVDRNHSAANWGQDRTIASLDEL